MEFKLAPDNPADAQHAQSDGLAAVEQMSAMADKLHLAARPTAEGESGIRPGPISVHIPAEVRLARYLWAAEYHASGLGMVDWWLQLDQARKDFAAAALRAILD